MPSHSFWQTSFPRRAVLLSLALLPLSGCSSREVRRHFEQMGKAAVDEGLDTISSGIPSTGNTVMDELVRQQFRQLADRLRAKWGDERIASPTEYVKYTDDYNTRAIVNFETGSIRVETIASDNPRTVLEKAIITTLLTPEDPGKVDLLSDRAVEVGSQPFLYNLVLDHEGQPIRWEWRAQQYASYLIQTAYQQDRSQSLVRHFVSFAMVDGYQSNQQRHYQEYVSTNSQRFGIRQPLIYAIMEAESSFNPHAMSHIPAYGLMQIVPTTAGRDSHELIYGQPGTPTKEYLFVPGNNVRMGVAYLSILNDRYLARVTHPQSREYCVIAGYNTGSGNVLRAFDSDRSRAFDRINALSPQQVYHHLVQHLPYQETRDYMRKVTTFERKYL
ncbi:Lytic transglycosylase catalytic [Desulfurispirillum indicum S5]|uniref:Lytic transglycosylase catalytic n=1 Tax=Desulfurispirillum indicum (strain ATCC BAA-1389 / DSM 22839 / S5) TaxID=653733 RepID=E6W5F9_DESIS|nr:murein transglycosylase domain-containing protein [Desulfurispirillum indicum]ADU64890.1 Lytic transglycosylase catalytic [Desulfurispirillum indicum S5]